MINNGELKLNHEIRIKLITNEEELKSKGHDLPVVELHNDIINTWISIKKLSFEELAREIIHINHITNQFIQHEIKNTK